MRFGRVAVAEDAVGEPFPLGDALLADECGSEQIVERGVARVVFRQRFEHGDDGLIVSSMVWQFASSSAAGGHADLPVQCRELGKWPPVRRSALKYASPRLRRSARWPGATRRPGDIR